MTSAKRKYGKKTVLILLRRAIFLFISKATFKRISQHIYSLCVFLAENIHGDMIQSKPNLDLSNAHNIKSFPRLIERHHINIHVDAFTRDAILE